VTSDEALGAVIDALNDLQLPYMVVGSFSSNFYGVPRATKDADVVIESKAASISAIAKRLGPRFRLDPQSSFETITSTVKYVFNLVDEVFSIEVFLLSDDPHDQLRFQRRRKIQLLGREAWLPKVEDVVIMKTRWASSRGKGKDWDDVRNVVAVSNKLIDWNDVYHWCDQHGTRELLDSIRQSIPPELG
jgi:hypothetical protein